MLALLAALALADIPPGPGYVETCTVERRCAGEGKTCSAYFGGREDCEALEKDGWVLACRTAGASVWSEVLCKELAPAEPATPEPATATTDDTSKCATVGFPGAWAVLVAATVARRRRRAAT